MNSGTLGTGGTDPFKHSIRASVGPFFREDFQSAEKMRRFITSDLSNNLIDLLNPSARLGSGR
jgi:hypothetical protein